MVLKSPPPSSIDFVAFSVFVIMSISLAVLAYSFGGVDFGVYYAAGRVLLQGGNPYDYGQLAGEIVSSAGVLNNPFYYAPWFAWAASILALFPYDLARLIWAVINLGLWYWGLHHLSVLIEWPANGWRQWMGYLFATILFAWSTWGSEQVGIIILFFLTLILNYYRRSHFVFMGICMALILFKPNITLFPIALLSIWLLMNQRWTPVLAMICSLLIFLLISVIVSPGWYLALFQPDKLTGLDYTLDETGSAQILRYSTTLMDWLAAYGLNGSMAYGIYISVALIGIGFSIWFVRKAQDPISLLSLAVLVNFVVVPYALFYDYSSLVLTLCWINYRFSLKPALVWVQRGMNVFLFTSLFVGNNISYRYWMVVVFTIAMAWGRLFHNAEKELV